MISEHQDEEKALNKEKPSAKNENIYDQYEMIYLMHLNEISSLEKVIKFTQIVWILFLLTFFVILIFQVQQDIKFSYFYLLATALLSVVSATIFGNAYLKIKDIFDKAQKIINNEKVENCSLGTFLSYGCLNLSSAGIIVYLILICLRLEGIFISTSVLWNIIAIPLYITVGMVIFYFIFILPAFIANKFYWAICVISTYVISGLAFIVLYNLKLDHMLNDTHNTQIFIPIYIALAVHLIYALCTGIYDQCETKEKGESQCFFDQSIILVKNFLGLTLMLIACILCARKLDKYPNTEGMEAFLPVLIFTIGYFFIIIDRFISLVNCNNQENQDEDTFQILNTNHKEEITPLSIKNLS